MIAISAQEKKIISERCPRAYIVRTMKHDSKRHHYYMTEDGAAMRVLQELRGSGAQNKRRMASL